MNAEIKNKLDKCDTLGELLNTLIDYYDVDNCKLGFLVKPMVISQIPKIIDLTQVKPKVKK